MMRRVDWLHAAYWGKGRFRMTGSTAATVYFDYQGSETEGDNVLRISALQETKFHC